MLTFSTLAEVKSEVRQIIQWYNRQRSGLGLAFHEALSQCYHDIRTNPRRFPKHPFYKGMLNIRRAVFTQTFPYTVTYRITDTEITVIAVSHMSQEEAYWLGRIK